MKLVYLLRHGRTEANDRHLYCGSTDLSLSPSGREALKELRRKGGYPEISGCRVITSGMRRAEETLRLFYSEVSHTAEPELREVDFGAFEMRGYEELCTDPDYRAWCEGDNRRNTPPGGESGEIMEKRVLSAFHRLSSQEGDLLIVLHGGPIAAIMADLFPEEGKNLYQWQPPHGTGYTLELDGQKKTWHPIPKGGDEHGGN